MDVEVTAAASSKDRFLKMESAELANKLRIEQESVARGVQEAIGEEECKQDDSERFRAKLHAEAMAQVELTHMEAEVQAAQDHHTRNQGSGERWRGCIQ